MTWVPHRCTCGRACPAPRGYGTQAAKKWKKIRALNRKILLVLVNHAAEGPLTEDEIKRHAELEQDLRTTSNSIHNRLSELKPWELVIESPLPHSSGKGTDYDYRNDKVAAYKANLARAAIVIEDGWRTDRLKTLTGSTSV